MGRASTFQVLVVLMLLVNDECLPWDNPPRFLGCMCSKVLSLAVRDKPCGTTVQYLVQGRCVRFTGDTERQSCALDGGSERLDYMPVYLDGNTLWVQVRYMKHADWNACQPNDENDLPRSLPSRCPGWPAATVPTVPASPDDSDALPIIIENRRSTRSKSPNPKDLTEGTCLCPVESGKVASIAACKKATLIINKGECFVYTGVYTSCKDSAGTKYSHLRINAFGKGAYVKSTVVRVGEEASCHEHDDKPDCDGGDCSAPPMPSEGDVYYPPRLGCQ